MTKTNNDYQKLSLKELKNLIGDRNLDCKDNKQDMISALSLHDSGKYIFPTTYEKSEKGFIVGISLNNSTHLTQISKLMERGEAKSIGCYSNDRVYYWSPVRLV